MLKKGLLKISVQRQNILYNFLMKARILSVLKLSSGPIRVANTFGWEEKAIYDFRDNQSSPKTSEQINSLIFRATPN